MAYSINILQQLIKCVFRNKLYSLIKALIFFTNINLNIFLIIFKNVVSQYIFIIEQLFL